MGSAPADPKVITAADAGKTVSLVVGGQLTVQLEAQPGTGCGWEADAASTPLLSFKGSKSSGTNMPGGIEAQSLSFVARSAGEGNLKLVYRRSWEKDVAPAKSFSVAVKISAH